jgi:hypothetical protein
MNRPPRQIEVDCIAVTSGVWWSATAMLAADLCVTAGYHRSRDAAVRALERKLNQIRNEADRLSAPSNIDRAMWGDFDVPTKEPA